MFLFRKQMMMLTASACIAAVASGLPAAAATPADTLVEALAIDDFAQIAEIVAAKDMARRVEIGEHLVATLLRRVDDRGVEHRILGDNRGKFFRLVAARDHAVPVG